MLTAKIYSLAIKYCGHGTGKAYDIQSISRQKLVRKSPWRDGCRSTWGTEGERLE